MNKTSTLNKNLLSAAVGALCLALSQPGWAISVTADTNVDDLVSALLSGGAIGIDASSVSATLTSHSLNGAYSSGTYTNASGTYGIDSGIVLSTGNVLNYGDGANTSTGKSTSYESAATLDQAALLNQVAPGNYFDVTELDIHFNMLSGYNQVSFNTTFGSEEYPGYVNPGYADGLGLFVNGTNIAYANGDPMNSLNPNMKRKSGTELNGVLGGSNGLLGAFVYTLSTQVNATGNEISFIIADQVDGRIDSTVYLSQLGGSGSASQQPSLLVPEPAVLTLFGMALAGLAFARRDKSTA